MPVFDFDNADVSSGFPTYLAKHEGGLPFVYQDFYNGKKGVRNDDWTNSFSGTPTANPYNSSSYSSAYDASYNTSTGPSDFWVDQTSGSYRRDYSGRVAYDRRRHKYDENGTQTFGVGMTTDAFFKAGSNNTSRSKWTLSDVRSTDDVEAGKSSIRECLWDMLTNPNLGVAVKMNGTWYNIYFPVEFDDTYAQNSTGGYWVDTNRSGSQDDGLGNTGALVNDDILNFRYTGTHPSGHNGVNKNGVQLTACRPSQEIMLALVDTALEYTYVPDVIAKLKAAYPDIAEQMPYVTSYAQTHFDVFMDIAWHRGTGALRNSYFMYLYNDSDSSSSTYVDGSSVSGASDLEQYKHAAKAMMFMALASDYKALNDHKIKGYRRYIWLTGLVNRRLENIHDLLSGSLNNTSNSFSINPNPLGNPSWYDGPSIPKDFYLAPDEFYPGYFDGIGGIPGYLQYQKGLPGIGSAGLGQGSSTTSTSTPTFDSVTGDSDVPTSPIDEQIAEFDLLPIWDFWNGPSSAGIRHDYADYTDIYWGQRSIYDTEQGSTTYYWSDPNFQSAYSKWWQDGTSFFHGATAFNDPRTPTKHGAVISSTQYATLPSWMLGLNENGQAESKVYIRSSVSQSLVLNGVATDDCYDIANGKTMGSIDYGQWNHFAITRKGNDFFTFKNGVKQDEWRSEKSVKIPQPDVKSWAKMGLNLSIGRSQISDYFYGYLDGIRITKGTALHNFNTDTGEVTFPVPTSAPTVQSSQDNYTGIHYVETVLAALNKIASQLDIEWRVRIGTVDDDTDRPIPGGSNAGKVLLDMGQRENVFAGHGLNEDATAVVVRGTSGEDPSIVGLDPSSIKSEFDAREYVSTVEYLVTTAGHTADLLDVTDDSIPYRDMHGQPLERVIYASEPDHPHVSKEERARAFLNELKKVKRSINLDLDYYDIQGDFEVGDMIFVYDPDLGFEDNEAKRIEDGRTSIFEINYQGEYINPEKIRVTSINWPIKSGYGVYLRRLISPNSSQIEYIDLSPYVQWESGGARLEVGDAPVKLGDDLRFSPAITGISATKKAQTPAEVRDPDNTSLNGINLTSGIIADALGAPTAIIKIEWRVPLNNDGSIIQNGSHYNIRYRKVGTTDPYTFSSIEWGSETFTIEGLSVGTQYEVGVQAVNQNGAVSLYVDGTITTSIDSDAPKKPGPAAAIAAGALRTQITHNLGAAVDDLGQPVSTVVDFTLDFDIDHLNVYASTTSGFTVGSSSLVGEIPVSASHLRLEIPVVYEIQMPNGSTHYFRFTAVDKAGNESDASDEQSASANLITTQYISDATITEAKIQDLAVTTAKITDAAITNAKIGDTIESDNYVAGTSGWIIEKQNSSYPNGYAEFSDIVARGNITATTGAIGGWDIASDTLKADYTTGGTTYYLTLDATAGTIEGNFATGSTGWQIAADGSVEFNNGTFRGDLTGATGTFSGGINIGNGTFVVNSSGGVTLNSITGFHITP